MIMTTHNNGLLLMPKLGEESGMMILNWNLNYTLLFGRFGI